MKFTKTFFAGMTVLISSIGLAYAGEGSTGTTGGGDTIVDLLSLLPTKIETKAKWNRAEHDPLFVVGTKKGWGFWPMNVYAKRFNTKEVYVRNPQTNKMDQLVNKCIASNGKYHQEVKPTAKSFVKLCRPDFASVQWIYLTGAQRTIFVDDIETAPRDLLERIQSIDEIAADSIDFERPESVIQIPLVISWLDSLSRIDSMLLLFSGSLNIESHFMSFFKSELEELRSLAQTVITNSICDKEKYELLLQRYRSWKTGTTAWFEDFKLKSGFVFLNDVKQEARRLRYELRGEIVDEVEPFCRQNVRDTILSEFDNE